MDLLTDIVRLMEPQTVLWRTVEAQGRWGLGVPYRDTPRFCLVVEGHCWYVPDEGRPMLMREGDYFLLGGRICYCLASDLKVMPTLNALRRKSREEDYVRWDDPAPGERTRLVGGHFQTGPEHAALLAALLPQMINLRSSDEEAGRLARVLELIGAEAVCDLAGRDLVMSRLVEIMLVEVLRRPMLQIEGQRTGWLSGMADPQIASALQRMHADVARQWTVDALAKHVGMSRAVFARRFHERVGVAPATYLSNWRIALAKDALIHSDRSIGDIALSIGYLSDSAFCTAFARIAGKPPAMYRKSHRQQRSAAAR
ncbi:AraC family transcriptional regulator [Paraburkholderia nodosa]|uniref:AraC family transcriptional regulator n=1 Tax=Paraburkholderia nodosa TaxID=392320 RepID=UPI0004814B93|nr:cupin domain-containing protein [Paraburkholderia nodosa]